MEFNDNDLNSTIKNLISLFLIRKQRHIFFFLYNNYFKIIVSSLIYIENNNDKHLNEKELNKIYNFTYKEIIFNILREYTNNSELKSRKVMIKIDDLDKSIKYKNSLYDSLLYQDYYSYKSKIFYSLILFDLIDIKNLNITNLKNYMNDFSRINKLFFEVLSYLKTKVF